MMGAASSDRTSPAPSSPPHSSHTGSSSPKSDSAQLQNSTPRINEDFMRVFQQAMATYYRDRASRRNSEEEGERILRPRVNLYESTSTNTVVATIEVPGLRKEEIQLTARNNQLTITGERRPLTFSDGSGRTVLNELKFGRFERVIPLPPGTEPTRISASMDDGMLTICWPLRASPEESDAKDIPVE